MHHSYDRLINLAKRTGDRLIVHDPVEGRDVVIMDIDEYEMIVDEREYGRSFYDEETDCNFDDCCNDFEKKDVRGMSEGELLDQINRDIAIWRTDKDAEDRWNREEELECESDKEGPFDPFAEQDYHPADWHSVGDVVEDRYKIKESFFEDESKEEENISFTPDYKVGDEKKEPLLSEDGEEWEIPAEFLVSPNSKPDEIKIDEIPDFDLNYEAVGEESITGDLPIPEAGLNEIPFKKEEVVSDWLEEPLGEEDEPVFYEEPV